MALPKEQQVLRKTVVGLQGEIRAARGQLDEAVAGLAALRKDSLSELSEEQQLRLQLAMDRQSKLLATLSNLLKKISDTSASIIQNIK